MKDNSLNIKHSKGEKGVAGLHPTIALLCVFINLY